MSMQNVCGALATGTENNSVNLRRGLDGLCIL